MLEAIRTLGNYLIKDKGLSNEAILTEEDKLENTKGVICIVFRLENENVSYDETHLEECSLSKSGKYLYRTFRHGHYDVTPTTRVTSLEGVKKRTLKR